MEKALKALVEIGFEKTPIDWVTKCFIKLQVLQEESIVLQHFRDDERFNPESVKFPILSFILSIRIPLQNKNPYLENIFLSLLVKTLFHILLM